MPILKCALDEGDRPSVRRDAWIRAEPVKQVRLLLARNRDLPKTLTVYLRKQLPAAWKPEQRRIEPAGQCARQTNEMSFTGFEVVQVESHLVVVSQILAVRGNGAGGHSVARRIVRELPHSQLWL